MRVIDTLKPKKNRTFLSGTIHKKVRKFVKKGKLRRIGEGTRVGGGKKELDREKKVKKKRGRYMGQPVHRL